MNSYEEFITIYVQKIISELKIRSLKDLVKLKPLLEEGTLKIDKS